MLNYLLRLLKIAFISTLGFGGGIGLLVFIIIMTSKGNQHAVQYGLTAGVVIGLIFTAMFFGVMMPLDLLFRLSIAKNSKSGETKALLENEQIRELTLQGSSKHVHFICRQALLAIPGIKNVHDDAAKNIMIAATGASWRSPGEEIQVQIFRKDENRFFLQCVSRPTMRNMVFDYGKNFENVEIWKKRAEEFAKTGVGFN